MSSEQRLLTVKVSSFRSLVENLVNMGVLSTIVNGNIEHHINAGNCYDAIESLAIHQAARIKNLEGENKVLMQRVQRLLAENTRLKP